MIGGYRPLGKDAMWIVCLFALFLIGCVDEDCDIDENGVVSTEVQRDWGVTFSQMADQKY